jgi:hypothetical protein
MRRAASEHLAAVGGKVADSDDSLIVKPYVLLRWPSGLELNRVELSTVTGVTMRLNQSA